MILTCPSCATGYFVPDTAIGAEGRKVRCKSCAHVWHAERNEEPLDLTNLPDTAPGAEGVNTTPDGTPPSLSLVSDAQPASLAETPAPELPKAFRARAEQMRRLRRAATHGAVWAGLASVFAGILASSWLFRVEVVELWPRAAAAYAAIGSPVNAVGLEFEAVRARPLHNDPGKVVVSGALRNVRDREVVSPAVRVALLDAHGAEVAHRIIPIRAAPVLPGKVQGFAVVIPDPGAKGAGIGVKFVEAEPVARPRTDHAEPAHPAPDHETPDHETPGHEAPGHETSGHQTSGHETTGHEAPAANHAAPAAAYPHAAAAGPDKDGGLRPAISTDISLPAPAAAIDAHPVAATPAAVPHH